MEIVWLLRMFAFHILGPRLGAPPHVPEGRGRRATHRLSHTAAARPRPPPLCRNLGTGKCSRVSSRSGERKRSHRKAHGTDNQLNTGREMSSLI